MATVQKDAVPKGLLPLLSKAEQKEFLRLRAEQAVAEPKAAAAGRSTFDMKAFVRGWAANQGTRVWAWEPEAWAEAARAKRKPMDEETKAYLRELGVKRKLLRPTQPKQPVDPVITLTKGGGSSKFQKESDRAKLVAWLRSQPGNSARLSAIEAQFQKSMKGVVGKLAEKGWVK